MRIFPIGGRYDRASGSGVTPHGRRESVCLVAVLFAHRRDRALIRRASPFALKGNRRQIRSRSNFSLPPRD